MQLTISERLDRVRPTIQEICDISGVPGASIGVVHQRTEKFTYNFGYQDVDAKIRPSDDTLYAIGSMTKAFVAAGIGKLVADGRLKWDDHIKDILPEFDHNDPSICNLLTVSDLLSHRSGLSGSLSLAFQGNGDFLLPRDQLYTMFNHLPPVASFRNEWLYNNWGYAIAGEVIEKVSNLSLQQFLSQHIFEPLGMNQTTVQPDFEDETVPNAAEPYAALANDPPFRLPHRQKFKNSLFESAGGAYSTLDDMLNWAKAILSALKTSRTDSTTLQQIPMILSNHVSIMNPSLSERSYGMGWLRTQIPGTFGLLGDNSELFKIEELPILGEGSEPRVIIYHQGATTGYYSAMYLDPITDSAVVVLTNSIAIGDAADWISQAVVQAMITPSCRVNYIDWAKKSRDTLLGLYEHLAQEFQQGQDPASRPKCLEPYTGRYFNHLGNFEIEIRQNPDCTETLLLIFQGKEKYPYALRHWQDHVFEWSLAFDEAAKLGRYHIWFPEHFKFSFSFDDKGKVSSFKWVEDPLVPAGQIFHRATSTSVSSSIRSSWFGWLWK
jgi:CubicO group peptidase (beta-lactamase class C family)